MEDDSENSAVLFLHKATLAYKISIFSFKQGSKQERTEPPRAITISNLTHLRVATSQTVLLCEPNSASLRKSK